MWWMMSIKLDVIKKIQNGKLKVGDKTIGKEKYSHIFSFVAVLVQTIDNELSKHAVTSDLCSELGFFSQCL